MDGRIDRRRGRLMEAGAIVALIMHFRYANFVHGSQIFITIVNKCPCQYYTLGILGKENLN